MNEYLLWTIYQIRSSLIPANVCISDGAIDQKHDKLIELNRLSIPFNNYAYSMHLLCELFFWTITSILMHSLSLVHDRWMMDNETPNVRS